MIKLDYTLETPEERIALVNKILEETPEPSEQYLDILAAYIVLPIEKEERKERRILTENRLATINKRETSFEGLTANLENGEDGIYNLITENKNVIFQPKVTITKKDIEEIPPLKQLREAITAWEAKFKTAEGPDKYKLKRALIEMRKDQYIIKNAYRKPITFSTFTRSRSYIHLDDTTHEFDAEGYPIPEGVSLLNPTIISCILCNYNKLKQNSWGKFEEDTWYLMYDFDRLKDKALANEPMYARLTELKIAGVQNAAIQQQLAQEFGITHSIEYISSLWRNKIPKLIASLAEDEYLQWYYLTQEKGKYKRCSRCGQIKLAHNKYFSKNKTSKDGFYSICKQCRNKRRD